MVFDPNHLLGHEFAGYRLEQLLGAGGAGTVYLGLAPDGRQVAVKVLAPAIKVTPEQLADFRRRFLREAHVLQRLQHPHILPLLASGEDGETGQVYLVTPYLPGGTLATQVTGRPLPLEDVVRYITEVAEALDYAHSQGVVHRDIKPSNVLLDEQGQAVLADFGIAKLVDALATQLTMTNQVVGTPEYMAPEQLRNQAVTAATDVFGVGALAYHLLTGQSPFPGSFFPEIMQKVLFDAPTSLRQLRLEVPPPAEAVVMKALAKDPVQRFASTGAMAVALAEGMQGQWPAGLQPPVTPPTQVAQFPQTVTPPGVTPPVVPPPLTSPETLPLTYQQSEVLPVSEGTLSEPSGPPKRNGPLIAAVVGAAMLLLVLACLLLAASTNGFGLFSLRGTSTPQPTATTLPTVTTAATAVTVTASTGPTQVTVPNVVNMTYGQAVQLIQNAGLTPQGQPEVDSQVTVGNVINTSPPGGTRVAANSVVIIYYSEPQPTVTPTVLPTATPTSAVPPPTPTIFIP